MTVKNLVKGLFATAALALAIVVTPASIVKAEGAQSTYTVERGDNLSKIAKKVYGNEKYWKVIYEANAGVVKSNYIIYKNQVLIIPAVDGIPAATTPAPAVTTPAWRLYEKLGFRPTGEAEEDEIIMTLDLR